MSTEYATAADIDRLRTHTHQQIADALEISRRTVQDWMQGRRRMYRALYLRACDLLGIDTCQSVQRGCPDSSRRNSA